jgi:DNA mismatch endonuclease (patch repair protein)
MSDRFDKETRSRIMARIRGKNTAPELAVRKFLFAQGFRFRLHVKDLPGKPDIVLPKYKTVIFVHGCFWHGHQGCKDFVVPKTRTDWWLEKIGKNRERDKLNASKLKKEGWKVIQIFECEIGGRKMDRIPENLRQSEIV